jgi:hypothetical protein
MAPSKRSYFRHCSNSFQKRRAFRRSFFRPIEYYRNLTAAKPPLETLPLHLPASLATPANRTHVFPIAQTHPRQCRCSLFMRRRASSIPAAISNLSLPVVNFRHSRRAFASSAQVVPFPSSSFSKPSDEPFEPASFPEARLVTCLACPRTEAVVFIGVSISACVQKRNHASKPAACAKTPSNPGISS